jgi:hypothetical protein
MNIIVPMGRPARLSVPRKFAAPRPLTSEEIATLYAIADVMIPAAGDIPAATEEAGFDKALVRAVDARADAFETLTAILQRLAGADASTLDGALRSLHANEPGAFQPLSAVVAGAWLLLETVRERIGYPGQPRDPAGIQQVVDELDGGILDPVIARGPIYTPTPE